MSPRVGSVISEMTFSSVDFPAPLCPMIPTTSPAPMSKLMSRSAHNVSRPGAAAHQRHQPLGQRVELDGPVPVRDDLIPLPDPARL